jgi:hypothetical protein
VAQNQAKEFARLDDLFVCHRNCQQGISIHGRRFGCVAVNFSIASVNSW